MYSGDDTPTQVHSLADEELVRTIASRLSDDAGRRSSRLARIKQAVESSDYENQLKLSVALDRLLDHLGAAGEGTRFMKRP